MKKDFKNCTVQYSSFTQLAFTLAETLIVIGIIGVVAALTLPNLNHATGDKETVTRVMKAYSMINEANDRAQVIYGPISEWNSTASEECRNNMHVCWMKRMSEFLKISKSCYEWGDEDADTWVNCDSLGKHGDVFGGSGIIYQLSDGITFSPDSPAEECNEGPYGWNDTINDICMVGVKIDINGPSKGKNIPGRDIFEFGLSQSLGLVAKKDDGNVEDETACCMRIKDAFECTWWVIEYGNLDYLKADEDGNCNDSNIVLDGVNNTSCH